MITTRLKKSFHGYRNSIKSYVHMQEVEIINISKNCFCSTPSKIININYQDLIQRSITRFFTSRNFNYIYKLTVGFGKGIYERYVILRLPYFRNIVSSVAGSNIKFSSAVNLKNHINNMLIFFHLYWLDIKQVLLIPIISCHYIE